MKLNTIIQGDCLEVMKTLPDNYIDAVVTDPPYGLSFMGKKWDYDVPGVEVWKECLRVLKPGGICLDPYMGSGTTGKGCKLENFSFIGIEDVRESFDIAKMRIDKELYQTILF